MWPKNRPTPKHASRPWLPAREPSAAAANVLTVALVLLASPAAAQVGGCVPGLDFGVGPALLANVDGERRLGAEVSASACSSGHDLRRVEGDRRGLVAFTPAKGFPFSWVLGMDGRFSLIHDGDLLPVENQIAGRAGISVSLSKPASPVDCEALGLSDEQCAERAAEVGATQYDWGFFAVSIHGGYESSLGFSEQSLAGGGELRYGHLRGYIPSIVVSYDAVRPVASDTRQAVGTDNDLYWRWMLQGYLHHQVRRVMGEVEAATYRANGLASALDALGWEDGGYVEATVSVLPEWNAFGVVTVDRIYVRYSDGRMPSLPAGGKSWGVGLALAL